MNRILTFTAALLIMTASAFADERVYYSWGWGIDSTRPLAAARAHAEANQAANRLISSLSSMYNVTELSRTIHWMSVGSIRGMNLERVNVKYRIRLEITPKVFRLPFLPPFSPPMPPYRLPFNPNP